MVKEDKEHKPKLFNKLRTTLDYHFRTSKVDYKKVDEQIEGINLNEPRDHHGCLILHYCLFFDNVNVVKYLLKKGADPNLETCGFYKRGNSILYLLNSPMTNVKKRVAILKELIQYDADVNATSYWREEKDYKNHNAELTKGSLIEFGLVKGFIRMRDAQTTNYLDERKTQLNIVEGLQESLKILVKAGAKTTPETSERLNKFLALSTKQEKLTGSPETLLKEAMALLDVKDPISDPIYDKVMNVCIKYLYDNEFIKTDEWATLVRYLIDCSLTFEDVAEVVYEGEVVSYIDDEGWLCQSWADSYNWFPALANVLAEKNAVKNEHWENLLTHLIIEHDKYSSGASEELEELFGKSWVKKHPARKKLLKLAEQHIDDFEIE